jgi:hypothetical protein
MPRVSVLIWCLFVVFVVVVGFRLGEQLAGLVADVRCAKDMDPASEHAIAAESAALHWLLAVPALHSRSPSDRVLALFSARSWAAEAP